MKTKLLLVLATALGLGVASSSSAQTAAPAATPASSWKITPAVVSQYMFRGLRLGGPAFQPSVEYSSGDLVGGIWASTPLDNTVPGSSDPEIDLYGSYSFLKVNDTLSFTGGATLYTYPDADKNAGFYRTTFEPSIAANITAGGLAVTPKVYYDFVLKGFTWEVSGAFAVPLAAMGTELDFSAAYGTYRWTDAIENSPSSVRNTGDYWTAGVTVPFAIAPNQKLSVGLAYHEGFNNHYRPAGGPTTHNPGAVGRGIVSASYSYSF